MGNAGDFFLRTETTVKALLEEIQACKAKIKLIQETVMLSDPVLEMTTPKITFANWLFTNKNDEKVIFDAQCRYSIEAFTVGLLAGSVLQIAGRAIELYSENTIIPDDWKKIFVRHSPPLCFFIGKNVHTVPLGLIIYAGRNQYLNRSGRGTEIINQKLFARLATHNGQIGFRSFVDRNLELGKVNAECFASNVLDVLNWNKYEQYIADMQAALL